MEYTQLHKHEGSLYGDDIHGNIQIYIRKALLKTQKCINIKGKYDIHGNFHIYEDEIHVGMYKHRGHV